MLNAFGHSAGIIGVDFQVLCGIGIGNRDSGL